MADDWIGAIGLKKGALRDELGVKKGKKIPKTLLQGKKKELEAKSKEGDLSKKELRLLRRINLAITFSKMKK